MHVRRLAAIADSPEVASEPAPMPKRPRCLSLSGVVLREGLATQSAIHDQWRGCHDTLKDASPGLNQLCHLRLSDEPRGSANGGLPEASTGARQANLH
jgi:hypothetical protein